MVRVRTLLGHFQLLPRLRGWHIEGLGGWHAKGVSGWYTEGVGGWHTEGVGGWHTEGLSGWHTEGVGGWYAEGLGGWYTEGLGGWHAKKLLLCRNNDIFFGLIWLRNTSCLWLRGIRPFNGPLLGPGLLALGHLLTLL